MIRLLDYVKTIIGCRYCLYEKDNNGEFYGSFYNDLPSKFHNAKVICMIPHWNTKLVSIFIDTSDKND